METTSNNSNSTTVTNRTKARELVSNLESTSKEFSTNSEHLSELTTVTKNFCKTRYRTYRDTKTILDFVVTGKLYRVMSYLISDDREDVWGIGGSVGALLLGCPITRTPHDIDIIVSKTWFDAIKAVIENDHPFFQMISTDCYYDAGDINPQRHIAFKTAKSPVIDVICYDSLSKEDLIQLAPSFQVMHPKHLLEAKLRYNRSKDTEDLDVLISLCEAFQKRLGSKLRQISKGW